MRIPLLLTVCSLVTAPLVAQPLFHRALAAGSGEVHAISRSADGHTFVASTVRGIDDPNWTRDGIHVVKYDANYTALWSQVLRNPVTNGDLDVHGVSATADGGVVVIGEKYLGSTDSVLVAKLNSNGAVAWAQLLPVPLASGQGAGYNTRGSDVAEAPNGDLVVAGTCGWSTGGGQNALAFVARFSAAGTLLWSRTLEASNSTHAYDVAVLPGGGIGVLGRTGGSSWLTRLQDDGTLQWATTYFASAGLPHRFFPTDSGFDLLLSTGNVTTSMGCLLKTDATGNYSSSTVYHVPGTEYPWAADITAMPGGGYLLLGYGSQLDEPANWTDIHALRIGTDGAVDWSVAVGSDFSETPMTVAPSADGGVLLGGMAYYHDLDEYRGIAPKALLVRIGADGAYAGCGRTTTAIRTDTLLTSAEHTLTSNPLAGWAATELGNSTWSNERALCTATAVVEEHATPFFLAPNPASSVLRITPATTGPWHHALLDATGRVLLQHAATHGAVELDVSSLAAGRYTLRSTAGGVVHHTAVLVVQ